MTLASLCGPRGQRALAVPSQDCCGAQPGQGTAVGGQLWLPHAEPVSRGVWDELAILAALELLCCSQ